MKRNYIFLMLGIFVAAELHGVWWHRPFQIGAHSLKRVIRVIKKHPIIVSSLVLLISSLLIWKRFKQNIWEAIRNGDAMIGSLSLKTKT